MLPNRPHKRVPLYPNRARLRSTESVRWQGLPLHGANTCARSWGRTSSDALQALEPLPRSCLSVQRRPKADRS